MGLLQCVMLNILTQITLKVKFPRNEEQHCLLPSQVDDFTCVHSKNALLAHISIISVLFSCTLFGTKSYLLHCMCVCGYNLGTNLFEEKKNQLITPQIILSSSFIFTDCWKTVNTWTWHWMKIVHSVFCSFLIMCAKLCGSTLHRHGDNKL